MALALGFSGLTLWLAVRQVDAAQVVSAVQALTIWPVVVAVLLTVAGVLTRAERWRWLLRRDGRVGSGSVLRCLLIGYLGNTVLPFRLGEVARTLAVAPLARVSVTFVAMGILIEKILDVGTLLALLGMLGLGVNLPPWAGYASVAGGILFALLVVGLFAVRRFGIAGMELLSARLPGVTATRRLAAVITSLRRLLEALGPLGSRQVQARAIPWSLVTWLLGAAFHVSLLWAFGVAPLIPAAVLLLAATNLSMVVPAAPSGLGVYHYLCVLSLGAFGVTTDVALAYALVSHGLMTGLVLALGVPTVALTARGAFWPSRVLASPLAVPGRDA
jgi:uncharacterized protein (TIRG00374 family)